MSRCNFGRSDRDVIGEVKWCLSVQTTVRHEAELESDPLWHVQPVQFAVHESFVQEPLLVQCLLTPTTTMPDKDNMGSRSLSGE